jgi:hypothetical protein
MDNHATRVKLVLMSIVIHYITILAAPREVLIKNDSIRRAIIWAVCGKVTEVTCKVNWETICKLKDK